jgi:hypothetical protein
MVVGACYVWIAIYVMVMLEFSLLFEACISFLDMCLTKPLLSRMAPKTRGQTGGNPPPPPEPSMEQVLRLMLEEREAARAERQANLATLQHLS